MVPSQYSINKYLPMHFPPQIRRSRKQDEQGYILMTLLLIMALMAIAATVIVSSITFEIRRDKEEEMIHRGVQYSRAIRAYYKKFNRYPAKIEDLENTNQMRFLRRRYKDPLTGKDFKILHYGEAKMASNALSGAGIAGASTIGPNGTLNGPGGLGLNSTFGGNAPGGLGLNAGAGTGLNSTPTQPSQDSNPGQPSGTDATNATTPVAGTPGAPATSGSQPNAQVFGGAPMVGVASVSKDKTIREFDKKKKYDEWQFVYDPTFDRGFLITTPYQPSLQQALGMQGTTNLNGQNGQAGSGQNGMGGFGNSPSPMQNNPTSPVGGYGNSTPNQPSNPPQQQ
jgi:type II secretory pathway pseudopilin PulG